LRILKWVLDIFFSPARENRHPQFSLAAYINGRSVQGRASEWCDSGMVRLLPVVLLLSGIAGATDFAVYCADRKPDQMPPRCVQYFKELKDKGNKLASKGVTPPEAFRAALEKLQALKTETQPVVLRDPALAILLLEREQKLEREFIELDHGDDGKKELRLMEMSTEGIAQLIAIYEGIKSQGLPVASAGGR
jgi:hypothetical protein